MSAVRGSRFFRGNERVFGGATRTEADKRTFKRPVREKLALRPAGRYGKSFACGALLLGFRG